MSFSSGPKAASELAWPRLLLDLAALILVVSAAIRLPVIQDEAYYWTWSTRPAAAYFDHPPLIAWVLHVARAVFGDTPLAIRLPSLLSMLGALWLSVRSAALLGDGSPRSARVARLVLLGSPMFLVGLIPATPDGLLALGAALAAYAVVRACRWGTAADWCFLGFMLTVLVGIKHYGALLSVGAVCGLLSHAEARRFRSLRFAVLGVFIGLASLFPWLLAELELGRSSSLLFQLDRVTHGRARYAGPISVPVTIGSMLLTLGPVSVLGLFAFGPKALKGEDPARRALYGGAFTLVSACFVAVWLGSGEANWPLPALVFAAPALALGLSDSSRSRPLIGGLLAVQVLILVFLLHMSLPFLPVPLTRDPAARGAGYAEVIDRVRARAASDGAVALGARSYQLASLLRYHTRDALPVLELGMDRASQYDRWPMPGLCPGDRVVTLTRAGRAELPPFLKPLGPAERITRQDPARSGSEAFSLAVCEVVGAEHCTTRSAR